MKIHGNEYLNIYIYMKIQIEYVNVWIYEYMHMYTVYIYIYWLVVSTPLKNMKVSWDDYSQYMEK